MRVPEPDERLRDALRTFRRLGGARAHEGREVHTAGVGSEAGRGAGHRVDAHGGVTDRRERFPAPAPERLGVGFVPLAERAGHGLLGERLVDERQTVAPRRLQIELAGHHQLPLHGPL